MFGQLMVGLVLVPLLAGCGVEGPLSPNGPDDRDRVLWESVFREYLGADLWSSAYAQDAGHSLMVPIHAAFWLDQEDWQADLAAHFRRFALVGFVSDTPGRLDQLHYLYAASRFVATAADRGRADLVPDPLVELLYETAAALWTTEPAWQWSREPFTGIRARIAWKLSVGQEEVELSYHRAIIDEDMFLLAIAADLRAYERATGAQHARSPAVTEMVRTALSVYRQRAVPQGGGRWLFQPGLWTDHHAYAYAGQPEKVAGMDPAPVPGIAEDASHSTRQPRWLRSFAEAYPPQSAERAYFRGLLHGLDRQFYEFVLVPPSPSAGFYRTTNYMDGRNGVYRWQFDDRGSTYGYGPFELSGTVALGWWAFLGSERMAAAYGVLAGSFPLPAEAVALYVGPNTPRVRHPLETDPGSFSNGLKELLCRLAAKVARRRY